MSRGAGRGSCTFVLIAPFFFTLDTYLAYPARMRVPANTLDTLHLTAVAFGRACNVDVSCNLAVVSEIKNLSAVVRVNTYTFVLVECFSTTVARYALATSCDFRAKYISVVRVRARAHASTHVKE